MPRRLFALLALLPAVLAAAPRPLESIDYFCPVTLKLVITRELDTLDTAKGTANAVVVTRLGNRELLAPVVAEHGGKLSDWRVVAYANSSNFENIDDLVIVARHTDGRLVPVQALDLSALGYLSAESNAYSVVRSPDAELLSASFDQKYIATCELPVADGTLNAGGTLTSLVTFGPIKAANQSLRAFKPVRAKLVFTGGYDSDAGSGLAEFTLTIGTPRLVPILSEAPDAP